LRFYTQAIHGQCQIIHRETSIKRLLTRTNVEPQLSAKLRLVLSLRAFAETELGLEADGHYLKYADLGRRYAVWNVYAAPEFSLEARSWWYPIVGRMKYQGYFNEEAAQDYAARLAARGDDVFVGGVEAYSTLGWFRDPVLNTFIFDSETDLAELLFHELAHQKVFAPGDTDFNEAFATATAEEGVRRWMHSQQRPDALAQYESEERRQQEFVSLLSRTRAKLELLYTNAIASNTPPAQTRARKAQVFADLKSEYESLKARWSGANDYDNWFSRPPNNARLNTVETYYRWVPAFRRILHERCNDQLEEFFREATRLTKLDKEARHQHLDSLKEANSEK